MYLAKEDEEDISEYPAIKWGNQHEQDGADKYNSIYQANKTAILDQILVYSHKNIWGGLFWAGNHEIHDN